MIIYDEKKLTIGTVPLQKGEDATPIVTSLLETIAIYKQYQCVAANQIGFDKQVGVINIMRPLYFVNPKIIKMDNKLQYIESNISYPNQIFKTLRFATIIIQADNYPKPTLFGLTDTNIQPTDEVIQEAVAIQQLIDTLNGILITKRETEYDTNVYIATSTKQGRNQTQLVTKDGEQLYVKYKLLDKYISEGWTLKQ